MAKSFDSFLRRSAMALAIVAPAGGALLSASAAMAADPTNTAPTVQPSHGVPSVNCRIGYFPVGTRLCMTGAQPATSYANAAANCLAISGRVADYADWRYRILFGGGGIAPVGWWLGPITADNTALFVNLPNSGDFDGETSRFDIRPYACVHERF